MGRSRREYETRRPADDIPPSIVPSFATRAEVVGEKDFTGNGRITEEIRPQIDQLGGSEEATLERTPGCLPVILVSGQTGVGKTHTTAKFVAQHGKTIWLTDRNSEIDPIVREIEAAGGSAACVAPLNGRQLDDRPNCLHPEIIENWQQKGYEYRSGFCRQQCRRQGESYECPFLASLDRLESADNIVVTKARARELDFFSRRGNVDRDTVVIDEDPIGLLRHPVTITLPGLKSFLTLLDVFIEEFRGKGMIHAIEHAQELRRIAEWCRNTIELKPIGLNSHVLAVPDDLAALNLKEGNFRRFSEEGRRLFEQRVQARMRSAPSTMPRNIARDLTWLRTRAAGGVVLVEEDKLTFHIATSIPCNKRVIVLDATASPELLEPLFAPRPIKTICGDRVEPVGRTIQFMDFNGPRSYLNKIPQKVIRILDALGDKHPEGRIILISHQSHVQQLRDACRHSDRIIIAHFNALRGRNDLMASPSNPIACHIVVGSPKTTEVARQQLALAIYGEEILPFPQLEKIRHTVAGRVPRELRRGELDESVRVWNLAHMGYSDPRMQAVYEHTVAAELAQAADRARVLIEPGMVYLLTNETCPWLWHAERCYADEFLAMPEQRRADFNANYSRFEACALEMLHEGQGITGASVCRTLGQAETWGKRYWGQFRLKYSGMLEGDRKLHLKAG